MFAGLRRKVRRKVDALPHAITLALGLVALGLMKSLTGKHRAIYAPMWFAALVITAYCVVTGLPSVFALAALQVAIGVTLIAQASVWGGVKLSRNEYILIGDAFIVCAFWSIQTWLTPGVRLDVVAFVALWIAFAVPWWAGRRIRRTRSAQRATAQSTYAHEVVEWWDKYVTQAWPELTGRWEWAPRASQGVLYLDQTSAREAIRFKEDIETLLNLVPGSLRLERRREDQARTLRVSYLDNVQASEEEVVFWTCQEITDGRLWGGKFIDGGDVWIPLLRPNGVAHLTIVAGSGGGKGVMARTLAIQMVRAPWVAVITLDGKHGQGLPSLRGGSTLFVDDLEEDIGRVIDMICDLVTERSKRLGSDGRSGWQVDRDFWANVRNGRPGDPLLAIVLDETHAVFANITKKQRERLEQVAAQGRSAGVSLFMLTQRADRDGMISTASRNNMFANGTVLVGSAGDALSGTLASAGYGGIPPEQIPRHAGWWVPQCRIENLRNVEFRAGILPDASEALEMQRRGVTPPVGLAEEWFDTAVAVRLHPKSEAIMASYGYEVTEGGSEESQALTEGGSEESQALTEELPTGGPTRARASCLPQGWEGRAYQTHRSILTLLDERGDMQRSDIMAALNLTANWTSKVLGRLRDLGLAEQKGGGLWSSAATE